MVTDTPYLSGIVEALCPSDAIYELIIGTVTGARAANDPDPGWNRSEWSRELKPRQKEELHHIWKCRKLRGGYKSTNRSLRNDTRKDATIKRYRPFEGVNEG